MIDPGKGGIPMAWGGGEVFSLYLHIVVKDMYVIYFYFNSFLSA